MEVIKTFQNLLVTSNWVAAALGNFRILWGNSADPSTGILCVYVRFARTYGSGVAVWTTSRKQWSSDISCTCNFQQPAWTGYRTWIPSVSPRKSHSRTTRDIHRYPHRSTTPALNSLSWPAMLHTTIKFKLLAYNIDVSKVCWVQIS